MSVPWLPWHNSLGRKSGSIWKLRRRSYVGRGGTSAEPCNSEHCQACQTERLQLGKNEKGKRVNQLDPRNCKYTRTKPHNCETESGDLLAVEQVFLTDAIFILPKCLRTWSISLWPLLSCSLTRWPHPQWLRMTLGNVLPLFNSGPLNSTCAALSAVACTQHASALRTYLVWLSDMHCRYRTRGSAHGPGTRHCSRLLELFAAAHL